MFGVLNVMLKKVSYLNISIIIRVKNQNVFLSTMDNQENGGRDITDTTM